MDLKEAEILGNEAERHWYYRSKASAMERYIGKQSDLRLLDVGAGTAFFSRHLLKCGLAQEALCVDTGYPREWEERLEDKPLRFRRSCGFYEADLVLMMDVLEHVEDDLGLLREYLGKVPVGARFLITVPAFQFLWSNHDIYLGHQRRYTLEHLSRRVAEAGLRELASSYYFGAVFPVAASRRLLARALRRKNTDKAESDLRPHGALVNAALSLACSAELAALRWNRIAGLSVFCLAEKAAA